MTEHTPQYYIGYNRVNKNHYYAISESEVYRWLQDAVKLKARVSSNSVIHVSEVVGCLRKSYYMRTRAVQLTPANMLKLLGDSLHSALQEVLRRNGWEVEHEVAIDLRDFKLVGHVDAYHPELEAVLEFKTTNSRPEAPFITHLLQTQIYRILTNSKHAYIIYISRTDGSVKVFKIENNKNALKLAIERAKQLKNALLSGNPPPKEKSQLCNYCEFQLTCR